MTRRARGITLCGGSLWGLASDFGEDDLERKHLLLGNMTNQEKVRTWVLEFRSFDLLVADTETRSKGIKGCGIEENIETQDSTQYIFRGLDYRS